MDNAELRAAAEEIAAMDLTNFCRDGDNAWRMRMLILFARHILATVPADGGDAKVRAAAENILRNSDPEYSETDALLCRLASHYLATATVPADDGEPVTVERFLEAGATERVDPRTACRNMYVHDPVIWSPHLHGDHRGQWQIGNEWIKEVKTMGQLRSLLVGLGNLKGGAQ